MAAYSIGAQRWGWNQTLPSGVAAFFLAMNAFSASSTVGRETGCLAGPF